MAPIVHLVRHAQGFHNLCKENEVIHDPLLTPAGKAQCGTLHHRFPHHASVDLVVSSPIRRTLYTSLLGFEEEIKKRSLKVLALPELQETSELPCDTGSSPEDLAKEFTNEPVDLHLVHHGWNVKAGKWAPDQEAIAERARVAREWLRNRHEKEIVVVTHGGLLHYLTEDFKDKDRFPGTGWANTEFRSYRFDDSSPHEAHLIETEDSKTCRTSKPLDHNEVTQLKRTMSQEAADRVDEANKEIKAETEDGAEGAEQHAQRVQSKLQQNARDDVETFL